MRYVRNQWFEFRKNSRERPFLDVTTRTFEILFQKYSYEVLFYYS